MLLPAPDARRPGGLPGPGRGAVAVQDFRLVLVPGGGGTVRVQHDGPALLVDHHLMVEGAEQRAFGDAGGAAVGLVGQVMHLAGGGGLVAAAGEPAALVPQDDGAADRGRDVAADADVQRQARPAQPGAELPAAEERGEPARTRHEGDGLADDGLLQGVPRLGIVRVRCGRARCAAHWARTWAVHSCISAELPSSRIRSGSGMWTRALTGCPARSGSRPAARSRRIDSWSASWYRWACVRVSSAPAGADSASSTAVTTAAHCGVRSP